MIETIFEALTGLRFSFINIIGLIVFYGAGVLFGRLTRNVGILKLLFAAFIAYYGFTLLVNASGAFIIAFIIGLATNHISFTMEAIYWAEDISDFLYALRHPEAFDEIRDAEQQESFSSGADSGFRRKARTRKQKGGRQHRNSNRRVQNELPSGSNEGLKEKHLRAMGLNPSGTYSHAELKRAFRKQALKAHPDTGGTAKEFQELKIAFDWLYPRA